MLSYDNDFFVVDGCRSDHIIYFPFDGNESICIDIKANSGMGIPYTVFFFMKTMLQISSTIKYNFHTCLNCNNDKRKLKIIHKIRKEFNE